MPFWSLFPKQLEKYRDKLGDKGSGRNFQMGRKLKATYFLKCNFQFSFSVLMHVKLDTSFSIYVDK